MFYTVSECPGIGGSAAGTQIKRKRGTTRANPEFAVECFLFHAVRWATSWYEISRMFERHLRFQFWREEAPERGRNAGKGCCGSIWQSWSV